MRLRTITRTWLSGLLLAVLTLGGPLAPGVATAMAQSTNGNLIVTVKDPNGDVIPGATIKVTDQETATEQSDTSNESGLARFDQLQVNFYTVEVSASGFGTKVTQDVKIEVGQDYGLVIQLTAGVSETVTVTAGEELVQTTNAEVNNTVTQRQIQDLPLDGRNPLQLIQLQAGVAQVGPTPTVINGQRSSGSTITQDGINIQDNFIRSNGLDFVPNRTTVTQVQEFSVVSANGNVENDGAGSVRLVTKSGSKDYHGEVYEYHRNDALGANDFFNNASDPEVERPQLIRNQFGFSFSGPVYIPKLYEDKDRFFFFGFYEGFREREGIATSLSVLSPAARQGNFTYTDNNGNTRTVNVLDLAGIDPDPFIANVLSRLPAAPNTIGTNPNVGDFNFNQGSPENRNQGGGRLDYVINDSHRLEGIYTYFADDDARNDIDAFNVNPLAGTRSSVHFGVAAWNWNITPTLINELRVGVNNVTATFFNDEQQGFTDGFFVGLPLVSNPVVNFQPQGRRSIVGTLVDSASYSWGDHFFRGGFQYDRYRIRSFSNFGRLPDVTLGFSSAAGGAGLSSSDLPGISATDLAQANGLLALLGGIVSGAGRTFEATSQNSGFVAGASNIRNFEINAYQGWIGDQWRVNSRLTVNVGVRYDYQSPLKERDNLALLPVLTGNAIETVLNPDGTFDFVDGFYSNPDRNNFAPNVGVAYDVFGDGKTVVRGGYSEAYINDEAVRAFDNAASGNDGLSLDVTSGAVFGTISGDLGGIIGGISTPPPFGVPRTFRQNFDESGFVSAAFLIDPDFQTPKYRNFNVSVERELGFDMAATARYVGTMGVDLTRGVDYNQVDVINNGFAADVLRAQQNGLLAEAATGVFDPRFNPNIAGSQQLTVFPLLGGGGLLTNVGTIQALIRTGEAGTLAQVYVTNDLTGSVRFTANPNTFVADVLGNGSSSDYHSLQLELRRRFSRGFGFQANYTWSKALTDANGTGQTRFDPALDNNQLGLERSRAEFDVPHSFKANVVAELPFGDGKYFDPSNPYLEKLVSGFQVATIVNLQSGQPFSILSNRGTLNRVGRSTGRNTANSSISNEEIQDNIGIYERDGVLYFINPDLIDRGVFSNPNAGEVGTLSRFAFNGPKVFTMDASVIKRTPITENATLELRAEFFNILNHPLFYVGNPSPANGGAISTTFNINSPFFGQIGGLLVNPRVVQLAAKVTF